ncbi:MAG: adenosylcobinamide-GDP ribazoletransferase [Acidaminococcaceae bacterium]
MRNFVTCLEFLTRIRFSQREQWTKEDFSRSVPYFPLVGLVIGLFLAAVNYGLIALQAPVLIRATLLLLAEIIITGGLMYDGFMDTADGVFSARDRERMLAIMKDSCVGANAVLSVLILVLLKLAVYVEMRPELLTVSFIAMSVATRTFMVLFIVNFPYARKEGIGHLFKQYAKPIYTYIAFTLCAGIIYLCGYQFLLTTVLTLAVALCCAKFLSAQLGGLTGDTYGALTETGNILFLLFTVFILH